MKLENQDDYIKYRFKRAEESFDDALILIEKKKWNTSINRLYYSCFYAVIALLLKNGIETHTHDGARIKFGNEFIKTGKIDKKYVSSFPNSLITGKKETMETFLILMRLWFYR